MATKTHDFDFAQRAEKLRIFHTRQGYSFNLSAGIAQSREILKADSNAVTVVFIGERLKLPRVVVGLP